MHLRIIPALLVFSLLCGCKVDLPAFDAASVELHKNGRVTRGDLSQIQADALADWVRTHRTGWEFRVDDAPLDGLLVFFKHRGVTVAVVGVRQSEIVIRGRVKAIAPDERAVLHTILASFITENKEANKAP